MIIGRFRRLEPTATVEPDRRFSYNNGGYVLLAEVLARVVGEPVEDLAAAALFEPSGLRDSRVGGPAIGLPTEPDPPGTVGDGGLWTSIDDLTRWLHACNTGVLGADVHRLAETATVLFEGSAVDYAWGVRVTAGVHGRLVTHGGTWPGWLAKTVRIPDHRVAVAILAVGATEQEISRAGTDLATAVATLRSAALSRPPPETPRLTRMRPRPGEVLHFSEDPRIAEFRPHVARTSSDATPQVWAVDADHAPSYWFPRQCPRAMAWTVEHTAEDDRLRILGPHVDRVHMIEYGWLERVRSAQVFAYRFDAAEFRPYGEEDRPHAFVAHHAVRPLGSAEPVGDLLELHERAGIELRLSRSLWPWWRQVITSSVGFSGIRLRNARSDRTQT